jgi:thioredoxin 1
MKILKFFATWCKPCDTVSQMFKEFKAIPIENIDIDENEDLLTKYNIRSVPTLILIDEKENILHRQVGVPSNLSFLDEYIK